ncbi:MAG: UDP-N-acetylmuramate--L-alanine ligase [Clostridiales bacterium]|nr:UDP-N-acetylmuramate--L-alanine ligase [Clostridiales bacterium]
MKKLHLEKLTGNHVHFIGIGGISMSALAEILLHKGYTVTGSDLKQSQITDRLQAKGIKIHIGHKASNIEGADWLVYTIAVKDHNPEIVAAKEKNLPIIERATLLGHIMETYPYSIGVAGSHGKTTATSMLSLIMRRARLDPTILVGGELDDIGGNVRIGNSGYFITEACEYNESFLNFKPYMGIILNIDEDHLDYFKDIDRIYEAFVQYSKLISPKGFIIGCGDDPLVSKLLNERNIWSAAHIRNITNIRKVSFAIKNQGDWMARDIKYNHKGHPSYRAVYKEQDMGRFELKVPGKYNIYNALAATAAAWAIGISVDIIRDSLASFKGTHRRFEIKGSLNDITVIDDYAHHPTEVRATLEAARKYPHKKIWCVFQPHTYTRTEKLFYEFSESFIDADEVILTDIYAAREDAIKGVNSQNLARAILDKGKSCRYMSSFDQAASFLDENAQPGDLVLTMGAGDVFKVADIFLKKPKRAT